MDPVHEVSNEQPRSEQHDEEEDELLAQASDALAEEDELLAQASDALAEEDESLDDELDEELYLDEHEPVLTEEEAAILMKELAFCIPAEVEEEGSQSDDDMPTFRESDTPSPLVLLTGLVRPLLLLGGVALYTAMPAIKSHITAASAPVIASVAAAWEQAVQQQEQAPSDLPLAETDCIEGAEREALTVEAAVTVDSANQSTAVLVTPPPSAEPAAAAELRVSSFNMLQRQRRAAAKQEPTPQQTPLTKAEMARTAGTVVLGALVVAGIYRAVTWVKAAIDCRMAAIDAEVEESRARFRARVMAVLCEDLDDEDELKVHAQREYAAYVEADQAVEHSPDDETPQGEDDPAAEVALEAAPDRQVDERSAAVAGWLALAPKVDGRSVPDTQIVERDFNWR